MCKANQKPTVDGFVSLFTNYLHYNRYYLLIMQETASSLSSTNIQLENSKSECGSMNHCETQSQTSLYSVLVHLKLPSSIFDYIFGIFTANPL